VWDTSFSQYETPGKTIGNFYKLSKLSNSDAFQTSSPGKEQLGYLEEFQAIREVFLAMLAWKSIVQDTPLPNFSLTRLGSSRRIKYFKFYIVRSYSQRVLFVIIPA
jgi:hypothetical protein